MPFTTRTRRVAPALICAILLMVASACGASNSQSEQSAGGGSGKGEAITIGQFSWTGAAVQTQILKLIAEQHPELGVGSVDTKQLDPAPGWIGMQKGDIDVMPEVNLPNQQPFVDKAKSETSLVSKTYGGATQGWFVPKYLVSKGGAAEGLTSVDQLKDKKWADAVGGKLYDSDAGWVTTKQNDKRIKGFNLAITHSPSSEAATLAQIKRSYQRKEPVLAYLYHPHWVFEKYDLVQLKEPKPYQTGCFEGSENDCAIPTLSAYVGARKDLKERAPKYYAMLQKFNISLTDVEKLLAQQQDSNASPEKIAKEWVAANQSTIDSWIK
ncbi:glycine/betaine ABC transporter substrate-binding protein [Acidipropionibacterium acidipropionici]|jgi:glycine betaine/proline transport system substrate-binding protein|uniref:ABC-type glycine betaine transport system substrate-binding domain-containing protein n=1 Tax=Acidipropionibacterium acidipropionici TaxID=1748 RepID=A0AAC8YGN0_9ACTN|nr:glycine betaine ABC transporter substrate-binding protein [Acidipropionibacterium acidipropionici]AMS06224.1 hypothetical protein AXH35_13035 [Acidipropionibacterium acidipropionici]AOZ47681.1 hypothetical protein A8L58_14485 [Acidipropionibacterium acidipropionici]AZP38984.1 glycine/betaine ABC transporter substrate-binding protein [Acidipropionibacterium acidipropionici]